MQQTKKWRWIGLAGVLLVLLMGAGLAAAAGNSQPTTAGAAQTATPTPIPKTGTIRGAVVNVRGQPGTNTTIVGKLRRGDRVQITGQRPGWLEIVYPSGSNGRGWISAGLVTVGGQTTSGAASNPGAVPAPVIVDYQLPNVLWRWDGENAVKGQDWYFDILLTQAGNSQPYDTAVANPGDVTKKNGVWSFAQPKKVLCDTNLVMAIATRKDGKWTGWVSPLSNSIRIGKPCDACKNPNPCPTCGGPPCLD